MKKNFINWFLVLLIMFIIFWFSNQPSVISSNNSEGLTRTIFNLLGLDKYFYFDSFHILIRKFAHFSIYFILGLAVYNALFHSFNKYYSFIELLILSSSIVLFYACSDEFHQLFISGRSGEVKDVLIDLVGGSVSSLIYYFILKIGSGKDGLQKR